MLLPKLNTHTVFTVLLAFLLLVCFIAWQDYYVNNHRVEEKNKELTAQLEQATIETTNSKDKIEKLLNQQFNLLHENAKLIKNLKSISVGKGHVGVTQSAQVTTNRNFVYKDEWQTIAVTGNVLSYQWDFFVGDVAVNELNEKNQLTQIYTVYLEGKKGTRKKIDYQRKITNYVESGFVWSPVIQAGISYYDGAEISGLISPLSYRTSDQKNNIIVLFPQLSVQTNFRNSSCLGLGAGYNISRHLPLFTDLWLNLHFVFGTGSVMSVSTSL